MEAGRNKRTSNKESSRAAGEARETGLTVIGRGLVGAGESQAPSRMRRRILRHRFGGWGLVWFGGSFDRCKARQDGTSREPFQYQPTPGGGGLGRG